MHFTLSSDQNNHYFLSTTIQMSPFGGFLSSFCKQSILFWAEKPLVLIFLSYFFLAAYWGTLSSLITTGPAFRLWGLEKRLVLRNFLQFFHFHNYSKQANVLFTVKIIFCIYYFWNIIGLSTHYYFDISVEDTATPPLFCFFIC